MLARALSSTAFALLLGCSALAHAAVDTPSVTQTTMPTITYSVAYSFPDLSKVSGTFGSVKEAADAWMAAANTKGMNVTKTTPVPLPNYKFNGQDRMAQWTYDYITSAGLPSSAGAVGSIEISLHCETGSSTVTDSPVGGDTKAYCTRQIKQAPPCNGGPGGMGQGEGTCSATPRPVIPASGVKILTESDYVDAKGILSYTRNWRSDTGLFASNVSSTLIDYGAASIDSCAVGTYDGYLPNSTVPATFTGCFRYMPMNKNVVHLRRASGQLVAYENQNGAMVSLADNTDILTKVTNDPSGAVWVIRGLGNAAEYYDPQGKLVKREVAPGRFVTYTYSTINTPKEIAPKPYLLLEMKDDFNRTLSFQYNSAGFVSKLIDPAGGEISYQYDEAWANCPAKLALCMRLTSVTYQDGKTRRYHYDEAAHIPATRNAVVPELRAFLTGMTDENGTRLGTYKYDANGKAISSGWNGNNYLFTYPADNQVTVTDPLGKTNAMVYTIVRLSKHLVWQNQPAGAGSAAGIRTFTYDANGNPKTAVDWVGNSTSFTYDLVRNLETSRTEAVGTADARTTSTQWHGSMALPVTIASPKLMTTLVYDAAGNLLSKAEQATTDANGAQGFAATKVGPIRQSTNTYNVFGQILTAKGPRTDVNDTTTYAYDVTGNLLTITNGAGHVTTYSDYDAHGRPHRITAPNKVIVEIDYSPRGWVRSRKISAQGTTQTTDYEYDGVGQLTKIYAPDGSYVAYTYDNAHQLTDIADGLGNSIHYTLDAMGNRLKEEVKDANGTLWRQATREFDLLNRLKKQTGAAQ